MTEALIVENIGKKYNIGLQKSATLKDTIGKNIFQLIGGKSKQTDLWACKDISFKVNPGDAFGIIGKNGAGKSTLLKLLSRITKPSKGRFTVNGRLASLLEVGTGFHPELTGRENIYLNGSILGMKRLEITNCMEQIVEFSGVEKFLDTPIKHYSSGMKVRLAFAVAAHLRADVLLIDEVLAVGDSEFQSKCLKKMSSIVGSGRTILFVSHNMALVRSLCKTGLLLENGKIQVAGSMDSCIEHYMSFGVEAGMVKQDFPEVAGLPIWMKSVELVLGNGTASYLSYGEDLCIKVHYQSNNNITPYLGIVVKSIDGVDLLNANNRYQPAQNSSTGSHVIKCCLKKPALMAGEYTLDLFLGDSAVDYHRVQNAIRFRVDEQEIWGAGILPPKNSSYLWCPAEFSFE